MNIIEMRGITKRFGSVTANNAINLSIPKKSIHSIIGENGAGKSTIMKILYGFYTADEGEIFINGEKRDIRTPRDAIKLGLGMVHQHFMLVENMTVLENIVLGTEPGSPFNINFKKAEKQIKKLSDEFGFDIEPSKTIEDLSVGEQQRVEVLKALYHGAEILILDEPTAVLTPPEVERFFEILRAMREQGKTIIIITHKLKEVLSLSDNVTIMRDGKVVGERLTANTNAGELARLMVGREVLLRVDKTPAKPEQIVLNVQNLKYGSRLNGVSFDVRGGEIVGIAGVEGNGQTELIEVLAGLHQNKLKIEGKFNLEGKDITQYSARKIKECRIAHIPEDRLKRGLLPAFDLAENSILGTHYKEPVAPSPLGLLDQNAIKNKAGRLVKDFDVRPPQIELSVGVLSGGNQQKLIIGREFDIDPKLLLVSQPTRGVDIGAIEFIHRKLIELRDKGAAILLVSAELEELLSLSDRILVMHQGNIVGEVDPKNVNEEEIGLMMTCGSRN